MQYLENEKRYLYGEPPYYLKRPIAHLQPILAKAGNPTVNIEKLTDILDGVAVVEDLIAIDSPQHWEEGVRNLGDEIDGILPLSVPALPTEIWNSHPQPLVDRGLPVLFWAHQEYDEPDFWRWSARDFLQTLGAEVFLVKNNSEGIALVKSLSMRRFLRSSKMVVFGEQNFPWNANIAGKYVTENLGTEIVVKSIDEIRHKYKNFTDNDIEEIWQLRKGGRYSVETVNPLEVRQAVRLYLAIKKILEEERAIGFGVNCFGDLLIKGDRDVPCLAQTLLREDGFIASCDGDFITMMSMAFVTYYLDKTCMMSNMYPISYQGAIRDHFGDPLLPEERKYPCEGWKNLARIGHCGFVGVVSPEMTPEGTIALSDWVGTQEINRDGRGCGLDGNLPENMKVSIVELCFDAKRVLLAEARIRETTRHQNMPHCESTGLLEFRDLQGFIDNISREHTVIVYGDHIHDLEILANVLGLTTKVF
jgi:hypothetical protein